MIMAVLTVMAGTAMFARTPRTPRSKKPVEQKVPAKPQAVDLGLSVRWADRNLGAIAPEDYGDYYAWGELKPKENYADSLCTTWQRDFDYTEISGDTLYDAACVQWGNAWRMPTTADVKALVDSCKWEPAQIGKVRGYRVTGPSGRSIFLPLAGLKIHESCLYDDMSCYYWSAEPVSTCLAGILLVEDSVPTWFTFTRFIGMPIRPVTSAK